VPTYETLRRFERDHGALSPEEKREFKEAIRKFVEDLERGQGFRKGLRVKGVRGAPGVFEMTWADDGRATFSYGPSRHRDDPHIIWHRVGTHDVLD
jgi:hypothetical protein